MEFIKFNDSGFEKVVRGALEKPDERLIMMV